MIEFIKDIAEEAGNIALAEMKKINPSDIKRKGDQNEKDLVTAVDLMVEKKIVSRIKERFPDHDIYGEESGKTAKGSEFCWIIDPIDGTVSYIHQTASFSVSIALQHKGEIIAGSVFAPKLGELFWAEKGKGAFLNGEKIRVSGRERLAESLVATGFACLRAGLKENNLKYLNKILPDICDIRRDGSAALDLAYVASGRYDAFWEMSLNLYDIAAGILLVEEAGGRVSDMSGSRAFPEKGLLVSNGLIHEKLMTYFA